MSSGGLELLTLNYTQMKIESTEHQSSTNPPLLIASVIISLPLRDKIQAVINGVNKNVKIRKEQGFPMTYKQRQMYEMGFEDAIEWLLGNEL